MASSARAVGIEVTPRVCRVATLEPSGATWRLTESQAAGPGWGDLGALEKFLSQNIPRRAQNGAKISACLSLPTLHVRFLTLPPMNEKEVPQAIRWELQGGQAGHTGRMEDSVLRYANIPEEAAKSLHPAYIAVTIPKKELESIQGMISRLGYSVQTITYPPLVFQPFFQKKSETSAHLHLGDAATIFSIWKGPHLIFTRELPNSNGSPTPEWQQSIEQEILRSLNYYREEFQDTITPVIWVTGSGKEDPSVWETFQKNTQLQTQMLEAPNDLRLEKSAEFRPLATAIAAALSMESALTFQPAKSWTQWKWPTIQLGKKTRSVVVALAALLLMLPIGIRATNALLQKQLTQKAADWKMIVTQKEQEELLDQVRRHRSIPDQPLQHFSQLLPSGIALQKITYDIKTRKMEIEAEADTLSSVSLLIRRVEESGNWNGGKLSEFQNASGKQRFHWEGVWR